MTNINDISKKTGFSKSTISRYLNNGSFSEKTSKKIKKAIDELGYIPNRYAQSLKSSSTKTIGIIIPNFIGYTKNIALDAINTYLKNTEYTMLISCSDDDMNDEIKIIKNMVKLKVDGIILFASDITKNHYEVFENLTVPLIIYGQQVTNQYSISPNDYMAGKHLGQYIKSLEHKEISFFDIENYDKSVSKRYEGLVSSLKDTDIKINHHIVNFTAERAYKKAKEILENEQSTFFIGATDNIAFGILKALNERKISIPEEISVCGFGDYYISSMINPPLTTTNFPYDKMGIIAIESLLNLIDGKIIAKHKLLDGNLIIRRSSK